MSSHCDQYNLLFNDLCQALESLELLRKKYAFVSNKTNSLHEACEHLLTQQVSIQSLKFYFYNVWKIKYQVCK